MLTHSKCKILHLLPPKSQSFPHTLPLQFGNHTSVFQSMSFFSVEGFICAICSIPERRGILGYLYFPITHLSLRMRVSISNSVAVNGFILFLFYGWVTFHCVCTTSTYFNHLSIDIVLVSLSCYSEECWNEYSGDFNFQKITFLFWIYAQVLDCCLLQWFLFLDLLQSCSREQWYQINCWRGPSSCHPPQDLLFIDLLIMAFRQGSDGTSE